MTRDFRIVGFDLSSDDSLFTGRWEADRAQPDSTDVSIASRR